MTDWSKALEDDLSWREAELGALKLLAAQADEGSVRYLTLLRALWCMLYAHYEGFFKFAWDLYLQALEELSITRQQANPTLVLFSLKKEFRGVKKDLSDAALWNCFTAHFADWMAAEMKFSVQLETQSNLWPNVAKDNLQSVGLPHREIDSHTQQLKALVSRRNDIAHGKPMIVKKLSEYQPYEQAAVMAMHEVALAVLESLEGKTYLR